MSGLSWYGHDLDRYARKTAHLSMLEHGAYRLLMDEYYRRGGPLPPPLDQVYRLCRAITKVEQKAASSVLAQFFELQSDGWHNKRADEELANIAAKRDAGRAGGVAAKGKSGRPKNSKIIAPAIAEEIAGEMADGIADEIGTKLQSAEQTKLQKNTHINKPTNQQDKPSLRSGLSARAMRASPKTPLPEGCPDQFDCEKACVYWRKHGRDDLCDGIEDEVLKFRAHHEKQGTLSANWGSSWTTWYANAVEFSSKKVNGNGHANQRKSPHAKLIEGAAEFIRELDEAEAHRDGVDEARVALPAQRS